MYGLPAEKNHINVIWQEYWQRGGHYELREGVNGDFRPGRQYASLDRLFVTSAGNLTRRAGVGVVELLGFSKQADMQDPPRTVRTVTRSVMVSYGNAAMQ